tara:strand:- start:404 stop:1801 length:1398 start_codon:yes stop_codon:yes gene_type:complete
MTISKSKLITFEGASGSGLISGGKSDKYATNVIETTVDGKKDFTFDVYRCPKLGSCTINNATKIGTRNKRGELTYNNNENDTERKYYDKVNKQTKSQATNLKPGGLTASEQETYNLRGGNGSQALINSTTADGVTIKKDGEQNGGDAPPAVTLNDLKDININVKGRNYRSSYGNYYYPEDLAANKQDRIRFTMKFSEGTVVNATIDSASRVFQRREPTKIGGSVTLPIVSGISDQNSVDWKGAELNPLQALGAGAAINLFETAKDAGIAEAVRGIGGAAGALGRELRQKNAGTDIATAMNTYLAQQAVGAQSLLSRTTGAVLNPNLEMLFNSPQLRNFTFTFKLSPRDASEANQVKKIIRFFKQGMSVKTSDSNVFLKAPNVFDINYQTFEGNTEITHPSINKIKTCALLSCDVQYTPDGTYMTYDDPDRTMTSYQLNLQFNELDPIYDTDYKDLDENQDTTLGY